MKKRFTEEQIIKALGSWEAGEKPKDLCRELSVHEQTLYNWKSNFGRMEVCEAKRAAASEVVEKFAVTKARVCRVLGLNRSTFDYDSTHRNESVLRELMLGAAAKHRRNGSQGVIGFFVRRA